MRKTVLVLASLVGLSLHPSLALAQSSTAVGVGTGAVAGAVVGGPIGAALGGVIGGVVGASAERPRARVYRTRRSVYRYHAVRHATEQRQRRVIRQESREFRPLG
jgi:uncharacterized membrane protein